ncbi:MAG: hypothetical protein AMXMBFR79_18200 [Chitinophagaceae bacterium]
MNAPILVFTYKRLSSLEQLIESLQKNFLAVESEVFIFSDAPKLEKDVEAVNQVRKYLKTISGFKKITVIEAEKNKGLATSIISGISEIIDTYNKVIVLEDDLVLSSNFLVFMNKALDYYEKHLNVLSISGFGMPMKNLLSSEIYFTQRGASWGWATWKNRWEKVDWQVEDYSAFKNNAKQRALFNNMGSDLSSMLDKQMNGKLDSWAIRFYYHQFKNKLFTIYPSVSKVINKGLENDKNATHTSWQKLSRFKTILDNSNTDTFNFRNEIKLDKKHIKQFLRQHSLYQRIKYRLINILLGGFKR